MGRLKKRVQRRLKKQVKQSIKKPKTLTKTPEQQAKENEMLKVMLSRQPQLIAGQAEKNDKLQQQLDLQKNALIQKQKEFQTQQEQLRQYKAEMDKMKSEINQAKAENDNQEKINREKEKGLNKLEKEEKRKQKLEDERDKLEELEKEHDYKTQEGQLNLQMTEAQLKKKQLAQSISDKEKEYNLLNRAAEIKAAEAENERLQSYYDNIKNTLESEDFKNQEKTLKDLHKQKLETEDKIKYAEQEKEAKLKIMDMKAKTEAYKEYIGKINEERAKLNKKGQVMKDKDGFTIYDDSELTKLQKGLAIQLDDQIKTENEYNATMNTVNYVKEIGDKVNKLKLENEQKKNEVMEMKKLIEGDNFKENMRQLEEAKREEEITKQNASLKLQAQKAKQRTQFLQEELGMRQRYNHVDTDLGIYQTQLQELGNQIDDIQTKTNNIIEDNRKYIKQQQAFYTARDNLLNRYENEDDKNMAKDNYFKLIEHKIGIKLPGAIDDWDINNLERTTAFTEMLGKLTPELLTSPDELDKFVQGEEFNNFEWKVV